jgi:hypothetical protein
MAIEPRKQRTRQHVIADLSAHYVERFILEEGHTAQRLSSDYSKRTQIPCGCVFPNVRP